MFVFMALLCGCSEESDVSTDRFDSAMGFSEIVEESTQSIFNDKLNITIQMVDQFEQPTNSFVSGETVKVNISLTNATDETLLFQSTSPAINPRILNAVGDETWSRFYDRAFPAIVNTKVEEIAPGERVELFVEWAGQDNQGQLAESGVYYFDLNLIHYFAILPTEIPLIKLIVQ